jgi:hypothetical protein
MPTFASTVDANGGVIMPVLPHNLKRTIVTVVCAAALVVLAVVVTMLPFVLL